MARLNSPSRLILSISNPKLNLESISQQSLFHSRCQTYPRKTDYPTDPRLRWCHLQNSLQHSTRQTGCSLSQCHPFCHQAPYTTHHCVLYALIGWPLLHIRLTHWLQVIYKSLLGKALPHLSSPWHPPLAHAPAGVSHWSSPKPTTPLAAFPSSSLMPMTGTNCKNRWSWRHISLNNFKHQLSEQHTNHCSCTQPVCKSQSNYLPLLHTSISTCTSSSAHLSLQC
jgi:hypothetical protein